MENTKRPNHRPPKDRIITDELNDSIYSVSEVANYMKLSSYTIRRMIRSGTLPATKIGRQYRIKKSDLIKFLR